MAKKPKKKILYPYEYDPEKRRKAKIYTRIKIIAGVINGMLVPLVFLLGFFFLGFSFLLRDLVLSFGILAVPFFIFLLFTLLNIVEFPLTFYSGYVYERKYQLSRYTLKGWFGDYFKGLFIEYVFSIVLLTILYSFIGISYWWIYAAILYFFVDIFMSNIYPVFILPFFYKLSPFTDEKLKKKLMRMIKSSGAGNVETIVVAKESEKSVKANAMFAGMGKTKKMILFDTLLNNFTEDETETVIGHELGHYVNKDVWRDIILSTLLIFPIFYIVHLALVFATNNYGLIALNDAAGFPLFLATMSILDLIVMPLENWYSRRRERAADWFGLEHSRKPKAQISTEKRLTDMALSDESPPPFVEWLLYTHPSTEKRISMVKEWEKQKKS